MRNKVYYTLLALGLMIMSCKEDVKNELDHMTEVANENVTNEVSKEVIEQSNDEKVRQSVMTKIMVTEELSTFASTLVTANLTNMLSTDEGPFTVFAPTSKAFEALPEETMNRLSNQKNKGLLSSTVKHHILLEKWSSADMVQALRDTDTLRFATLAGKTLKVVKNGEMLYVIDIEGTKATIGDSDISGNNGVVHFIDNVLGLN